MTTKLNLATKCPLTFLMHLDRLQDINSTVNWNIIRSLTSLLVKEAFFPAILTNPGGRGRGRQEAWQGRGEDRAVSALPLQEEVVSAGLDGYHGDGTNFRPLTGR